MIASEKGKNMPALWISAYIHMQLGTGFVLLRMLPENALYWPRRTGGGKRNGIGGSGYYRIRGRGLVILVWVIAFV